MLTEGNRNYWIVKQLTSAGAPARPQVAALRAVRLHRLADVASSPHKAVGDWQALFGINLRCPHLSWYTMEGEAKRDYPASIFYQSAWWKDYAPSRPTSPASA